MIWWRYINKNFLFGNMEKNLWKNFSSKSNSFLSTRRFIAEYSKETTNFLDVNIRLVGWGSS